MPHLALPTMSPVRIDATSTALSSSTVDPAFGLCSNTVLVTRLAVPMVVAVCYRPDWARLQAPSF